MSTSKESKKRTELAGWTEYQDSQDSQETKEFRPMKRRSTILGRRYNTRSRMKYAERASAFMKGQTYWKDNLQERIELGRTPEARANRSAACKKMCDKHPHLRKIRSEAYTAICYGLLWPDPAFRKMQQCVRAEDALTTAEGRIGIQPVLCERAPSPARIKKNQGVPKNRRTGVVVSDDL